MPKIKRKLLNIGKGSTGVIIPRVLCEMLDLEKGDMVDISIVGSQIIIKKGEEIYPLKKFVGEKGG